MAKAAPWLKDLRSVVRRSNGPGWVLEEQYGRFKIQKIEGTRRSARRPSISTPFPFAPSSSDSITTLVKKLRETMADQNIGLADAYQLIADSPELTGEAINWKVVAERYRSFRVDSGTVSESNYTPTRPTGSSVPLISLLLALVLRMMLDPFCASTPRSI